MQQRTSTAEVAALMQVTRRTVQERRCNQGRIECEKEPSTGKWRISGYEYDLLRRGERWWHCYLSER